MVAVDEINDRESFERWLQQRPTATRDDEAALLAIRIALRVVPAYAEWAFVQKGGLSLARVPIFRANLISVIAGASSNRMVRSAAVSASFAAGDAESGKTKAARAAADAGFATDTTMAKVYAEYASEHVSDWSYVRSDCRLIQNRDRLANSPIWHDAKEPFDHEWRRAKEAMAARDEGWEFWIRWYEAARSGQSLNPDMLHKIATQNEDDFAFWNGSDAEVNARIAEIVAEFEGADPVDQPKRPADLTVVRQQVRTLLLYLDVEIEPYRGRNDFNGPDGETLRTIRDLLQEIVDLVQAMQDALDCETEPETALVVVEETLPQVIDKADDLAQQMPEPVVSETIVHMTAAVKHMTEGGVPPKFATGIALLDQLRGSLHGWFNRKKDSAN